MVSDAGVGGNADPLVSKAGPVPPTIATIADAVAQALGQSPMELPPLYDAVDISAVVRVLSTGGASVVTFDYQRLRVTVAADGTVEVYSAEES